jgi:hypothetical protein
LCCPTAMVDGGGISTTPLPRFVLINYLKDIKGAMRCHKGSVKVL